ncbi:oxidoreductase [Paracoccus gahaiensis]|uniref:oxidoreductase n=1 Tax=Paracoccus gahaiensis TaxID=1706839 RepID=UPI001FE8D798|nr:oxidoreductase [Paracoccus gahaiensis]
MFKQIPAAAFVITAALSAVGFAEPQAPLLTVTSAEGIRTYTLPDLEALPQAGFTTSTIWTDRAAAFEGVPLRAILDANEIAAGTVLATAINDYAIEIPVSDVTDSWPIVAYRMDSKEMSRRDKGPLWVMYPFDAEPSLSTEVNFSRSIWQLDRLSAVE